MTVRTRRAVAAPLALAAAALWGCSELGPNFGSGESVSLADLECSIPRSEIFNGGPGKDGIPALTDPTLVFVGAPGTEYLRATDRVIGLELSGQAIAVPLNILWWHEIVNLSVGDRDLAITHCPLTGSSLAFDRSVIDGGELGVSGLLYMNNLLMYDRTTDESLWPQMLRGARCGPRDGTELPMVPALETTWESWQELHPGTRVIPSSTGFPRDYTVYPYGSYGEPHNTQLLFPVPHFDTTRPPKERVLGIPAGTGGTGFPFGLLADSGPFAAVHVTAGAAERVVFWDSARGAAMAYEPVVDGQRLSFSADADGIVDEETGSQWRVDGLATGGTLEGARLPPVQEAFISFWFAWRLFYPDAVTWDGS